MKTTILTIILFVLKLQAMANDPIREHATLGAGCFWCTEAVFRQLDGVVEVTPGYSGGHIKNPAYKEVCNGTTGHAEVARIEFDPAVIDFGTILSVFFKMHDPTTLNRQGNDVGTQYRSVIFYHSPEQQAVAKKTILDLEGSGYWKSPIVTQIEALDVFYPAEDYHKDYYKYNSQQPYCQFVVKPKIEKIQQLFPEILNTK